MSTVDPHPASAELAVATAADIGADIAAGRTTSVDVTGRLLDRIAAIDQTGSIRTRAVLAVAADALDVAARLDDELASGGCRGPLHGVPVLIKDNIEAIGLPGTAGSLALADRVVTRDAPLVANLRGAGLVVLGSTNLSEWANIRSSRSTSGWSAVGGLTANPWALDRSAGGSSSGSGAAIAGGLAPLAIGTETDGSITCPSSLNGCVGLKPTVGLLSTVGIVPISKSQDAPGPMARSARDVALLMDVLAGSSDHASASGGVDLADVRVGVARRWYTGHAATDETFEAALEVLGAQHLSIRTSKVSSPARIVNDEMFVLLAELRDDLDAYLRVRPGAGPRSLAEVVEFNRAHADVELIHFAQELFELAVASEGTRSQAYADARARCLAWAIDECLGPALAADTAPEFLVAPASPPAWKTDFVLGDHNRASSPATSAPSIAGWPILCVPMGLVSGLPVGMVLIGRPDSETRLLAVANEIEHVLGLRASGALTPTWNDPTRP
ncbi:MAG TPA: amidase family protein [Acidimicrobiia bacterium]|nr:amidase family protein [Acidimicrobiia bacterium]